MSEEFEWLELDFYGYDIAKQTDENGVVEFIAWPVGAQVSEQARPTLSELLIWCEENTNDE